MDRRRHVSEVDQSRAESRTWKRLAVGAFILDALLTVRVVTLDGREKIIVVPPGLQQEFWVRGNQVSPSYLDAMARWYAGLALTFSPTSVRGQGEVLLRYTDPLAHGALAAKLAEDADRVDRTKISEVFYPVQSRVRAESLQVALSGDLVTFVGAQAIPPRHVTYVVQFASRDGQLSVTALHEVANESDPFGDQIVAPPARAGRVAAGSG